ncbi:hypothetical protein D3C73_886280 [compost metagenome]
MLRIFSDTDDDSVASAVARNTPRAEPPSAGGWEPQAVAQASNKGVSQTRRGQAVLGAILLCLFMMVPA